MIQLSDQAKKYTKYIPYLLIIISIAFMSYSSYYVGTMEHRCNTALKEQFDRLMEEVEESCPAAMQGEIIPGFPAFNITFDDPGGVE